MADFIEHSLQPVSAVCRHDHGEIHGRGAGQMLFVRLRESEARRAGATKALVSIAPDNKYSLDNLIDSGYEIIETRPLHEGELRHILSKKL